MQELDCKNKFVAFVKICQRILNEKIIALLSVDSNTQSLQAFFPQVLNTKTSFDTLIKLIDL